MSGSTDEDEFVCIFKRHLTKPHKFVLMTFNTRREEKIIAETDYRRYGAMACVDGKNVFSLAEDLLCVACYSVWHLFLFQDVVYIMGGSADPDDEDGISYEVMTVNLRTGDVGQIDDTIYGVTVPAAASSLNRIVLCGGESGKRRLNCCQVYSPKQSMCVCRKSGNIFS